MPNLIERIRAFMQPSASLSIRESDSTFYSGTQTTADLFRDRFDYDRRTILSEVLRAWRSNPVARWAVQLTNVFVLGTGFEWECRHRRADRFLRSFWEHRLNRLDEQLPKWLDEQTRSGDLFLLWTVDQAGMPYVRAVPSERIREIQSAPNDYQQERYFIQDDIEATVWPAFDEPDHGQTTFMTHYAINQPVGCQFGESDLSPLLPWLGRLSTIVNDRVAINHVRSLVSFVLQGKFMTPDAKRQRQMEIEMHPPKQGSVLVTDESETWSVLAGKLDGHDAHSDILAVKKMIAVGMGVPLHYLAEPESATRTTAEAAGTPTFRRFDDRQRQFKAVVGHVLRTALAVRRRVVPTLPAQPEIVIKAGDVTERDNSLLSLAAARIEPALGDMFDRRLIEPDEYVRIFYRMIGEFLDEDRLPGEGLRRPLDVPRRAGLPDLPSSPEDISEDEP